MNYSFLMSSERSGSNLITKLIDAHPLICGPSPSHMIRLFASNINNYGNLENSDNWNLLLEDVAEYFTFKLGKWKEEFPIERLKDQNFTPGALDEVIRYMYSSEAKANQSNWVFIKENKSYQFLPYLLSNFENSKFVYLVRDPRDTVLSFRKAINLPFGLKGGLDIWIEDQERFLQAYGYMKSSNRVLLVKYEDLVTNTKQELIKICALFGIDFHEDMLSHSDNEMSKANSKLWPEWSNLSKPVLSTNINKFKNELKPFEIQYIETKARDLMTYFNYEFCGKEGAVVSDAEMALIEEQEKNTVTRKLNEAQELDTNSIRSNRLRIINRILNYRHYQNDSRS